MWRFHKDQNRGAQNECVHFDRSFRIFLFCLVLSTVLLHCSNTSSKDEGLVDAQPSDDMSEDDGQSGCSIMTEDCKLSIAESFFPMRECLFWKFDDGTSSFTVQITDIYNTGKETVYITDYKTDPDLIALCDPLECPAWMFYLSLFVTNDGVYIFHESGKDLIYKRNAEVDETYELFGYPVTVEAADVEVDIFGQTYSRCNRYLMNGSQPDRARSSTVCYDWGWVEIGDAKLVDTNVDDYIANCEVVDE